MRSVPKPPPIYPIADHDALGDELPRVVEELAAAGADWIQVRAKNLSDRGLFDLVDACCRVAAGSGAQIWVNDRPDLAALLPVAGVHLGQRDLPPGVARGIVGPDVWIGSSTHNEEQLASAAVDEDVDVVAVGPVFPTVSKCDADPVAGLELVSQARRRTAKPLVAIGGVNKERVGPVLAAGADSAAVIGAIGKPPVGENYIGLVAAAEGAL